MSVCPVFFLLSSALSAHAKNACAPKVSETRAVIEKCIGKPQKILKKNVGLNKFEVVFYTGKAGSKYIAVAYALKEGVACSVRSTDQIVLQRPICYEEDPDLPQ